MGLAFQIIDDLLDVTGSAKEMGKNTHKDDQAGKLTYPAVLGIKASAYQADKLVNEALAAIEPLNDAGEPLRQLARILSKRKN